MEKLTNHVDGEFLSQPEIGERLLNLVGETNRYELFIAIGRKGQRTLCIFDNDAMGNDGGEIKNGRELESFLREVAQVDFKRGSAAVSMANLLDSLKRNPSLQQSTDVHGLMERMRRRHRAA